MPRIVIELTNRCNLSCQHCFSGRHGGNTDLPLAILDHVLAEAGLLGFDFIAFTGGDPTVYRHFADALARTSQAGFQFGMVTNGQNFKMVYPVLLEHRDHLNVVTFSVDGATESSHDKLRGKNSFRRVMQAASICMFKDIPFSINMVVTRNNQHEVAELAELAAHLGSRGVRFGHLMHSPITTADGQDLSSEERKRVEAEIADLQRNSAIAIAMGPGYFTDSLFPCAPLQMQEVNVDCHGNLTKCCHLSGHGSPKTQRDVIGNLAEITFGEAYRRLVAENDVFRETKMRHHASGQFDETDYFPCWYCSRYYSKLDWLRSTEPNVWQLALR
ncbi:radical SAM protein [Novipirellula caenicola]|uniref:PqqA peptide cyclase n=1 Tax=Novipirellula caenicola TaxID=1536901 RepID=A0ABP9VRL9_9BACT